MEATFQKLSARTMDEIKKDSITCSDSSLSEEECEFLDSEDEGSDVQANEQRGNVLTLIEYRMFLKYCQQASKARKNQNAGHVTYKRFTFEYLVNLPIPSKSKGKMLAKVEEWKEFKPIDSNEVPIVIND